MKKVLAGIAVTVLALMAQTTAAAAQDYSGTNPEQGVWVANGPVDAGDQIGFQATNLQDGSTAAVYIVWADGTRQLLQTTSVSGGVANLNFALPSDLPSGSYTLAVEGTRASGDAFGSSLTITTGQAITAAGTGSGAGGDTLAVTGVNTPSLIGIGSALALLGAGFVVVSRRKQSVDLVTID